MTDQTFQTKHNNITFYLSTAEGFTVFGHNFDLNPKYNVERPIEFWKAQLAFRGFSPRGSDVAALKGRLKAAKMDSMDDGVTGAFQLLVEEYRAAKALRGNRKRKADEDNGGDRQESIKRALAQRKDQAASAQKRINDRYKAAARKGGGGEGSSRLEPADRPKHTAIRPKTPPRRECVLNRRIAENNPDQYLRDAFFDEDENDMGHPPVESKNLCPASRAHLHQACDDLGLFHETTVTSVMVIGSGKNTQGQQKLKELNRAAGWPPVPYVSGVDNEVENEEEEEQSEEDSEVEEGSTSSDGDSESSEGSEEEEEQEWDITGNWEIKCPHMAGCFGQYAPYTLEIFSSQHRVGQQVYGRFDFGMGAYKGVFRFSSQQEDRMGNPCKDDIEEFLLPNDILSAQSPTISYRWRGREGGENVIQLGSENYLYQMTFSDGGRRVDGTWGHHNADPGTVTFSGIKIGDHALHDGMGIQYQWNNLDQATYDQENRDRWRRRW
jgi:hypothetical protein